MKFLSVIAILVGVALFTGIGTAAEGDAPDVKIETVCRDLQRPSGVAVQPSTGHIYVADSGVGRVLRVLPEESGEAVTAIDGFATGEAKHTPFAAAGPTAMVFLHQNLIVVGSDKADDEQATLFVFELPTGGADGAPPLKVDQAKQTLSLKDIQSGETQADSVRGLAIAPTTLWLAAGDKGQRGSLLMAGVMGTQLEAFHTFPPNRAANHLHSPSGIAFRFSKDFIVVGQMGALDEAQDSSLAFIHTISGALMMELPVKLHDLVGLAYSPASNRLYAIDLSWATPEQGGLYRLDSAVIDGRAGVKLTKLAQLDRPTAMAFAPDNSLYITTLGSDEMGDQPAADARGSLVKVTGDL